MSQATYLLGDVREVLATLPDASVDLVLTSPPFLALRNYLPDDHPDKDKEIGQELTPGEFVDVLLDISEECRRVLAPHGSLVVELGDTYAGSGGAGGDYADDGMRAGQPEPAGSSRFSRDSVARPARTHANRGGRLAASQDIAGKGDPIGGHHMGGDGWPENKSLALVPELYRVALAYGVNPLTGRRSSRWKVRNVVRWCRPNPSVGELFDKVRPATSDMVVACTSKRRFYDGDAVRRDEYGDMLGDDDRELAGSPPLDHQWYDPVDDALVQDAWLISGTTYRGQHYATWPADLLTLPILSMCPQRVCVDCGAPARRLAYTKNAKGVGFTKNREPGNERAGDKQMRDGDCAVRVTTGWSCCGCRGCGGAADSGAHCDVDHWRRGVVLDPFGGTGTTGMVAVGCGRDAVMIDLDERNLDLARERLGLFLAVERPRAVVDVAAV